MGAGFGSGFGMSDGVWVQLGGSEKVTNGVASAWGLSYIGESR